MLGLRKYQQARRGIITRSHHVVARQGPARLLKIGDEKQKRNHPAVILIPSLINSHLILDLSDNQSLGLHLMREGFTPYLVDWGIPGAEDTGLNLDDHVTQRLVPLIRSLNRPVHLVGYCLGGTLALGAAAALGATEKMDAHPPAPSSASSSSAAPLSLTTIAAPWHFDAYPPQDLGEINALWRQSAPLCEKLGIVPMEVLQNGFWALDPRRTISKYAAFADMPAGSAEEQAFLAVEDWANEGAPLTFAAGQQLFTDFYGANISGNGEWRMEGQAIRPENLRCPSLSIRSTSDHIVPAGAAPPADKVIDSDLGHVGMVISRHAPQKIWKPLSDWLSNPTRG